MRSLTRACVRTRRTRIRTRHEGRRKEGEEKRKINRAGREVVVEHQRHFSAERAIFVRRIFERALEGPVCERRVAPSSRGGTGPRRVAQRWDVANVARDDATPRRARDLTSNGVFANGGRGTGWGGGVGRRTTERGRATKSRLLTGARREPARRSAISDG